ncbi:MAG: NifU family protein [Candidatus Altiarchaeales archaeon]|nr:NifU family protein [Candidatus Altiarchaeales archaeon]
MSEEEIKKELEKIRPMLQMDGGDVEYVDYEEGVLKVRLTGMCRGCPMSQITLKQGIEQRIKEKIADVLRVEAVE